YSRGAHHDRADRSRHLALPPPLATALAAAPAVAAFRRPTTGKLLRHRADAVVSSRSLRGGDRAQAARRQQPLLSELAAPLVVGRRNEFAESRAKALGRETQSRLAAGLRRQARSLRLECADRRRDRCSALLLEEHAGGSRRVEAGHR